MKTRYLLVGAIVAVAILAAVFFGRSTLKSPNADSGIVGKWYEYYGRPGQKTWEFFEEGASITTNSRGEQSITDYKLIDNGSRISFRSPTSYVVAKLIMDTPDAIDLDFGANDVVHLVEEFVLC